MTQKALIKRSVPPLSPANCFHLPDFVVTSQVQRVIDLCASLQQTRTLGMLVGLPGVGKTWAACYAAQQQPQPEEIAASPVLYTSADVCNTPRALITNLLNCLGPDHRAPVPDMTQMACCWIHRRQVKLIIVDEADRLDEESWELLRDIHDRTHCAFLFVGQLALQVKLRRHKQLLNRVSITMELHLLAFDELMNFLLQLQPKRLCALPHQAEFFLCPDETPEEDLLIVKELYRVTFGNLRKVCHFILEAERIATVNGQRFVELPVAKSTAQLLAGEQKW